MNARLDNIIAIRSAITSVPEEDTRVLAILDTSDQVLHALTITNVIITLMAVNTTAIIHKGRSTVLVEQVIIWNQIKNHAMTRTNVIRHHMYAAKNVSIARAVTRVNAYQVINWHPIRRHATT